MYTVGAAYFPVNLRDGIQKSACGKKDERADPAPAAHPPVGILLFRTHWGEITGRKIPGDGEPARDSF